MGRFLLDTCNWLADIFPQDSVAAVKAILESKKAMRELKTHYFRIMAQYVIILQGRQKGDLHEEWTGTTVKTTGCSDPMALLKAPHGP